MSVSRSKPLAARVAILVAATVLGVLIGRSSAAPPSTGQVDLAPKPRPTRAGAVIAATRYLAALRWNVLVDDQRRLRVVQRHAVPEAVAGLDAELASLAEGLRGAITEPPVVARSTVLGYRVEASSERRAVVSIWGMALFATGTYKPTTQWSTSAVELAWSGDRWLVASVRSRGGPSPDSRLTALAEASTRFHEVRHVP